MQADPNKWYVEPVRPTLLHQIKLNAILYSGRTAFQTVEIIDTDPFGLTLVLDGKTQSAQADEFIYHEALVHPAMVAHPDPRSVLIAGGGEGATLREVLAHRTVQRAVMVDLDRELVALCREHLPGWHRGAFDDPRGELVFDDARRYLEQASGSFDVIIVDITDPTEGGPSLPLFTEAFYRMALGRLTPGGIFVTQAGPASHGLANAFTAICSTLRAAAGSVHPYRADVPSFGGEWGFALAVKDGGLPSLTPREIDGRIGERVTADLGFYDGDAHAGLFALPRWLRRELASQRHVITEERPVYID